VRNDQLAGGTAYGAFLPRWLVFVALGVPLALIILAASPFGLDFLYVVIGIPALLLVWKLAGVYAAALSVRAAVQREWRQAIAASVLPLLALFVALDPHRLIYPCEYVGNVGRFVSMRLFYDISIAGLPTDGKPRLAEFDWDGIPSATFAVIYDESDQITLPRERQTAAWQQQAKDQLSCEGYGVVQSFWAHYYLVTFPC
jgi:hypothetical protein